MKRLLSIFKAQIGNNENKGLVQNVFSLSVLQIASYIIPLITLPYLIRVLGAENFGKVSFAMAYVFYFIAIVDYSFPLKATKEIAISDKSEKQLSHLFSVVMYTKFFLFLIGLVFTIVLTTYVPALKENKKIILYTYPMVLGMIFYPFWFFQGIEDMKFITFNNLISRSISVLLILIFVKTEKDFVYVPLINSAGFLLGGIYALLIIYKRFKTCFVRIPIQVLIHELKEGWNIFLIRFVPNLYNNSSVFILGLIAGNAAVAYFTAGKRIVDAVQSMNQAVTRAFYPFLNRRGDKFNKAKYIIIGSGAFLSLGILTLAYPIYKVLFTEDFLPSFYVMLILGFSPLFISIDSAYGSNGLLRIGKDKIYKNVILLCALVGIISGIFLIKILSFYGAALNLVLVRGIIAVVVLLIFKKINNE
jgi:PST family polysaccharide transporter